MQKKLAILSSLSIMATICFSMHAAQSPQENPTTPEKPKRHFAPDLKIAQPLRGSSKNKESFDPFRGDPFGASLLAAEEAKTPSKKPRTFNLAKLTPSRRRTKYTVRPDKEKKNEIDYSEEVRELIKTANKNPNDDSMKFIATADRIVGIGDAAASPTGSTPEKQIILHKLPNDLILYALEHGEVAIFQSRSQNNLVLSIIVKNVLAEYHHVRSYERQLKKGCLTIGFDLASNQLYHAKFESQPQNLGIPIKPFKGKKIFGLLNENNQLYFSIE